VEARARASERREIFFDRIRDWTENLMMAAALAEGKTVLNNAAREPEVSDLADLLRAMGADISGDGSSVIQIKGAERLHGAQHTIIPDRIETGTFLAAGAITGGDVEIRACWADHLSAVIEKLEETGVVIERPSPSVLSERSSWNQGADATTLSIPASPPHASPAWR
jgi:UDP-N-acetylglucosamine 1-carboxyvinyltransferase